MITFINKETTDDFLKKQQSSNIIVITSIIQRQMEVFLSSMIPSVLIGKFLQSMPMLSEKDTKQAMLKDFDSSFDVNVFVWI